MSEWISGDSKLAPCIKKFPEFAAGRFNYDGVSKGVYRSGSGPAVIVIHEIPNLYDQVFQFAQKLNDHGFTTFLPSLVGKPGGPFKYGSTVTSMAKICVSKEFKAFAFRQASPITHWLRALARYAHAECGGPGVGAIGMCLSGGFALAMMADKSVIAPVLSQPSLPFAANQKLAADIDTNAEDIPFIRERMEQENLCLLGLRFSHDRLVPEARFKYLKETFGDRFVGVTIDSSPNNPHKNKITAHSVLTRDFVDQKDHPTKLALMKVIELFERTLKAEATPHQNILHAKD